MSNTNKTIFIDKVTEANLTTLQKDWSTFENCSPPNLVSRFEFVCYASRKKKAPDVNRRLDYIYFAECCPSYGQGIWVGHQGCGQGNLCFFTSGDAPMFNWTNCVKTVEAGRRTELNVTDPTEYTGICEEVDWATVKKTAQKRVGAAGKSELRKWLLTAGLVIGLTVNLSVL